MCRLEDLPGGQWSVKGAQVELCFDDGHVVTFVAAAARWSTSR